MVIYSWLALRWAVEQFQREEVLFPRGRAAGRRPVAAAAVPRQGGAADGRPGVLLLRPAHGAALAVARLRPRQVDAGRHRGLPARLHGGAAAVHGAAADHAAAPGAGPAPAALVVVAGGGGAGRAVRAAAGLADLPGPGPVPGAEAAAPGVRPARRDAAIGSRPVHPLSRPAGGAAGGVRGAGVPRLHPERPAPPLPPVDGGVPEQLPLRPVSDERLPVRHLLRPGPGAGPRRAANRQRGAGDGLPPRVQPLHRRPADGASAIRTSE